MIFAQSSATPKVLRELPLSESENHFVEKRKLRSYDLFKPFSHYCGYLDVTRYKLFDDEKGKAMMSCV